MESKIPEVNINLTEVYVEHKTVKTKYVVVEGIPVFGMHKSLWKENGIKNRFNYWLWKRKMRKQWKKK